MKNGLLLPLIIVAILLLVIDILVRLYFWKDLSLDLDKSNAELFNNIASPFASILAIGGLIFTIYLQIKSSAEGRRQQQSILYFKLIDDLKFDLENVQRGEERGIGVWTFLIRTLKPERPNVDEEKIYWIYLYNIIQQIQNLKLQLQDEKVDNHFILTHKILLLHHTYLSDLFDAIIARKSFFETNYPNLCPDIVAVGDWVFVQINSADQQVQEYLATDK